MFLEKQHAIWNMKVWFFTQRRTNRFSHRSLLTIHSPPSDFKINKLGTPKRKNITRYQFLKRIWHKWMQMWMFWCQDSDRSAWRNSGKLKHSRTPKRKPSEWIESLSPSLEENKGVSCRHSKITVKVTCILFPSCYFHFRRVMIHRAKLNSSSEKWGDAPSAPSCHHQLQCVKAPETDGRMIPFGEGLDPNQDI